MKRLVFIAWGPAGVSGGGAELSRFLCARVWRKLPHLPRHQRLHAVSFESATYTMAVTRDSYVTNSLKSHSSRLETG